MRASSSRVGRKIVKEACTPARTQDVGCVGGPQGVGCCARLVTIRRSQDRQGGSCTSFDRRLEPSAPQRQHDCVFGRTATQARVCAEMHGCDGVQPRADTHQTRTQVSAASSAGGRQGAGGRVCLVIVVGRKIGKESRTPSVPFFTWQASAPLVSARRLVNLNAWPRIVLPLVL